MLPVCEPLLAGNELRYVTDAVSSGWISSSGSYVTAFEQAFAAWCGVAHGVAVCNGTVALHLALVALGVGPGDEVILPDFTMVASALAVCHTGAMPVFVDVDPATWNINPLVVEAAVTPRTKAIMAVHIFGTPCDMTALAAVAVRHGLELIEDAAEAHGATFQGKKAGSLSRIAAFSFFANKNVTTGEGGMVVTDDPKLARACRYYKNLCFPLDAPRDYRHAHIGYNYRMSNLHAAIGLAQTEKADDYTTLRVKNGRLYRELLAEIPGVRLQAAQPGGGAVHWMNGMVVTSEYGRTRDSLMAHLKIRGIDSRLFFNGMHRQPALERYGCQCAGAFPVSDCLADGGLYLPSASGLTESDIRRVCQVVREHGRS
ncbi:aminotransferase DegT [Desulfovibrio aerotolerans]|uniref:Aminotransferase DegT n=2 Tax=Solidesulfovibrio aerotolerans TaxID=295255 RepID=A0A7C9IND0_9BACT|nr:aminotransferase DegT [Solidesulfovibrio aerotolerans]